MASILSQRPLEVSNMDGKSESIRKKIASPETTSPVRMLVVLTSAVFVVELSIMVVFNLLPPIPAWVENFLDAFILAALLFPILYYLVFRPLTLSIERQKLTETELLKHRDHLAQLVESRTKELQSVNITTDSKLAEKQIVDLRRLYATLSHINCTVKHARNWEDLLRGICKGAVEDGKFEMVWAGLVGHATQMLNPVCHYGREDGYLENIRISMDDVPESGGPFVCAIRENRVAYVNYCATDEQMQPWCERMLCHGFLSVAALPLRSGDKAIGALMLYSGEPGFFDDDHLLLLEDMASEISYALTRFEREAAHSNVEEERERALKNMQKALQDSIHAIAYALEMRDPYTAGHQRQVAQIATAIGREMALPEMMIEGLHFGSLIHDLGKISLPAEILTRPRRLTSLEMQMMQTHPQAGYDIIQGIDYPWPVAEMVLQHHERMDGSGYPNGLKGEDIPLEARIVAVADVVDAMTSHRPYRAGLGIGKALEEIERNRGTYYDPLVVDACLRLFREKGFKYTD
jgi:GAF domain-containing protein